MESSIKLLKNSKYSKKIETEIKNRDKISREIVVSVDSRNSCCAKQSLKNKVLNNPALHKGLIENTNTDKRTHF